jgi:N-acetylmuramoyl-L-alanine amidase
MRKALILTLLLTFSICYSEASKHTAVQGIRYSTYDSYTRIVIDINGPVEYTQNRIPNPDRLFFDLKKCSLSKKIKSRLKVDDGILKTIRIAQYAPDTVRLVFDVNKLNKYYSFMLEDPNRLVVDVYSKERNVTPGNSNKSPVNIKKRFQKVRTVVIDAGHGGKDPGAIGPKGLKEKDVTLQVSKKLGKLLEKKHKLKVVYTRDKDKFVSLNQRTHIANSKKADLFISVHVNASRKRSVKGIETYFLNWTNDREAMRVAARENKISIKKMKKVQDSTQFILQDLARKNKNEESMRFAHSVQNSMVSTMKKDYSRIDNLGVKYALFYVLVGAEMPSILVEVSFISNRIEEKRLSTEAYKNKLAEAIAKGVNAYITQSTLIVNSDPKELTGG